uniref:Global nitrogen transcriptional regulator n=1 Tax=Spermothamnion repens TaxID=31383 RepID=A0A4D6WY08_9FLOR|nr:global nitrogen transcriptional regulator [Spermothamnion repens]
MKYVQKFSQNKLSYYIYKLNKGDSIIQNNYYNNHIFIILKGIIYKEIILKHEEILPIGIFNTNHIIETQSQHAQKNQYDKLTALEITYIISFQYKKLYYKIDRTLLQDLLNSYTLTLQRYEAMNYIVSHTYNIDKILQLILFLCREFGYIQNNRILIPLFINKKQISTILKCNMNTLNNTIKIFKPYIRIDKNTRLIVLIDLFFFIASEL